MIFYQARKISMRIGEKLMTLRLQRYMAEKGVASRRKSEGLILDGQVKVNGKTITELGTKIDSEKDIIHVCGKLISENTTDLLYYLLNKPKGWVSTASDQFARPAVTDLINSPHRLYPVGRLDYNTTGLLILTNDGDLTYRLTHPKHAVPKTYEALLQGRLNNSDIEIFKKGLDIGGYITKPAVLEIISTHKEFSTAKITITEGKNRQIRKMCAAIGHDVLELKRIAIGKLHLGALEEKSYRLLNTDEIAYLKGL